MTLSCPVCSSGPLTVMSGPDLVRHEVADAVGLWWLCSACRSGGALVLVPRTGLEESSGCGCGDCAGALARKARSAEDGGRAGHAPDTGIHGAA